MNQDPLKRVPSSLEDREYLELRSLVLRRDGWRCQNCGDPRNLQVHHIKSRSKLRDDAEENLIALCANCHAKVHNRGRR